MVARVALGARLGRLTRAGSGLLGVLAGLVRGWLVWFEAGVSWACEHAIRARKQGVGARRSIQAPVNRVAGRLGLLREVLPLARMARSGSIWAGSGVGEGISGERGKERERER